MKCRNCGRDNCGMTKTIRVEACSHRSSALGPCASCRDRFLAEIAKAAKGCVAHIVEDFTSGQADAISELREERNALQHELANLRGFGQWNDIAETPPDFRPAHLVCMTGDREVIRANPSFRYNSDGTIYKIHWHDAQTGTEIENVTHWISLPSLPCGV